MGMPSRALAWASEYTWAIECSQRRGQRYPIESRLREPQSGQSLGYCEHNVAIDEVQTAAVMTTGLTSMLSLAFSKNFWQNKTRDNNQIGAPPCRNSHNRDLGIDVSGRWPGGALVWSALRQRLAGGRRQDQGRDRRWRQAHHDRNADLAGQRHRPLIAHIVIRRQWIWLSDSIRGLGLAWVWTGAHHAFRCLPGKEPSFPMDRRRLPLVRLAADGCRTQRASTGAIDRPARRYPPTGCAMRVHFWLCCF